MDQYNEGTKKLIKKKYPEAVKLLTRAAKNNPTKEVYLNLGAAYKGMDNFEKSLECITKALQIDPNYALAWNNLGLNYHVQQREELAEKFFRESIRCDPDYKDAIWNLSLSLLKQACSGDESKFREGWELYEIRFTKTTGRVKFPTCPGPRWRGEEGTILVVMEQGLGDVIMFSRYLPLIGKERVKLICPPECRPFFDGWDIEESTLTAKYDYWVPICSLPMYFSGIPRPEKYITHSETVPLGGVGVVWQGNANHANDRHRSHSAKEFLPFRNLGKLWSLQYGVKPPTGISSLEIKDFNDTMSYINGLDLIITVDTSVAHLAAAMGKPVWNIVPNVDTDFRWGCNGDNSIWYPTMKIFRNIQDAYDFSERYTSTLNN